MSEGGDVDWAADLSDIPTWQAAAKDDDPLSEDVIDSNVKFPIRRDLNQLISLWRGAQYCSFL